MSKPRGEQNREDGLTRLGWITELFSSIQGEGPFVGCRQIFIRLYGCHRNCWYCDSPETVTARHESEYRPATYRVDPVVAEHIHRPHGNPAKVEEVIDLVDRLHLTAGPHHSVALTGGEPLLQIPFLQFLLPTLRLRGHRIYLETTGDLPTPFEKVAEYCDIVAMDIKLPSATKERARWEQHRRFLRMAHDRKCNVFVKVVTGASTTRDELEQAASLVHSVSPEIPFIIQPATALEELDSTSSVSQMLSWQRHLSPLLKEVRIIPQTHKIIGFR